MNQKYELSGEPGKIWLIGLPLGAILSIILSIIYAYIMVYNPFIYINIFIFVGFLAGIFFIQTIVVNISKCRSLKAARIYGAIIGIITLYANWSTFLYVVLQRYEIGVPLMEILASPLRVVELMSLIAEDGYYSIFGLDVSGFVLWLMWIIEAAGIIAAGIFGGQRVLHEEVFCENCNRWAEDIELDLRLSTMNSDAINAAIERNIVALAEAPLSEGVYPQLKVNIHHCSVCDEFSTVNVDIVVNELKKDKYVERAEDYSDVFVISNDDHLAFKNLKEAAIEKQKSNAEVKNEHTTDKEDSNDSGDVKPSGM